MQSRTSAAVTPILLSPTWLTTGGFVVIVAVLVVQAASGIPAWRTFSPVELSSNLVAATGLVWALIQLRTYRRSDASRRAWTAASLGMALLAVEGNVGALLPLETHDPGEMTLSIAMGLAAAALLFRGAGRYAMRRSVREIMRCAFALQVVAQAIGWLSAVGGDGPDTALLEYLNDTGELVAVLGYLAALLLAEFAPIKDYRMPSATVGRKGRLEFLDFVLRKPGGKYPIRYPFLRRPVARQLLFGAKALWFGLRVGPLVSRNGGPSIARQLIDLARLALQGVDAVSYYVLGLSASGAAGLDEAVTRVETKDGLTSAVQRVAGVPRAFAFMQRCCRTPLGRSPMASMMTRYLDPIVSTQSAAFEQERAGAGRGGRARPLFDRR